MSTATAPLYEISSGLRYVREALEENGGELTPELEAILDQTEGALEEKIERILHVLRDLELDAEKAQAEATRLQNVATARKRSADRLKEYVRSCLETAGVKAVETAIGKVWRQTNGRPSIRFTGELEDLPEDWRKVSVSADTQKAYEAWKADHDSLPDGFVVELGEHLRVQG